MRVIIAGGGTGGHVIPALAVAAELRRRGHHQILLVGTARGLEARLAPQHGLPLETIDVGALKRVGLLQKAPTLFRLPYSFWQSGCILDSFQPDVVYGVGGYASGPVLFMAAMKGIPIVVHEPNAAPGFANRCVAPFVTRALVGFPEAARYFPATQVEVVGVPVRAEFFQVPRKPHLPPFTLLIFGGSQGARSINRAVIESLPLFASSGLDVRFIHQTGEKDFREAQAAFEKCGLGGRAQVLPFIDDMPAAFAIAQVAVIASTSAETFGRTSIEAQAMGCPVIVSDIGAAPETIIPALPGKQNYTGWVIACHDPTAIAERVAEALTLPPLDRDALGARARRQVAAKFTLSQMQRATLAVYDELLGSSLADRFDKRSL